MRIAARDRSDPFEINVIPLIDVMLTLLMFFVVTATFEQKALMKVALPQASPLPAKERDEALTVLIEPPALNGAGWTVVSAGPAITITEDTRPFLLHLRFLQEWLIAQTAAAGGASAGPHVVAAGVINGNTTPTVRSVMNGLQVQSTTGGTTEATQLTLSFGGYTAPLDTGGPQYLVKALPWPKGPIKNLSVAFGGFRTDGFLLMVSKGGAELDTGDLDTLQLMVEVSQYA